VYTNIMPICFAFKGIVGHHEGLDSDVKKLWPKPRAGKPISTPKKSKGGGRKGEQTGPPRRFNLGRPGRPAPQSSPGPRH
jgi:hypothetical protein